MGDAIQTRRLELVSISPACLEALVDRKRAIAEHALGFAIPDGFASQRRLLTLRLAQLRQEPALQPWLLRALRCRESGLMIGHIGFHSRPGPEYLEPWVPGGVELGITVYAHHRRQGYAKEAIRGMMEWAGQVHGVGGFVMTVSPSNEPSQQLAKSLGFVKIGIHDDEVDGIEDVFKFEYS